jgi:hypothetical protein
MCKGRHHYDGMVDAIVRRPSVLDPEWYRQAIRARGYTLESFAPVAGISRKTLGDWLAGRRSSHLRTEVKVYWALKTTPVVFDSGDAASWRRSLPPHIAELLGPDVRAEPGGEGRSHKDVRRRPPSESAYLAALATVPPLRAWQEYGYRLVASGRAGAAFRHQLAAGRPWLAFPEVFGDEAGYRATAAMDFRPLWP